jgi:predicted aspartyl protease
MKSAGLEPAVARVEAMKKMGTFRIGCTVVNVANRRRSVAVDKMLVDTGSDYTWLPAMLLEKIGVQRRSSCCKR